MTLELLARMLDGWWATRDPELEDAIGRVGRGIARARGRLVVDRERDWTALAIHGDAGDVDRLLDVPWHDDAPRTRARIAALARYAPDPRISRKYGRVARRLPWKRAHEVHAAIAAELALVPTPAVLPYLDALETTRNARFPDPYAAARAAIAAVVPRAADPALLAEAHAEVGDGRDLAALWAAHAAEPDAERRMVLADALLLANDPRGELIQLQTAIAAGEGDRKMRSRVAMLLETHLDEWHAPFFCAKRETLRFERGFVTGLDANDYGGELARSLGDPAWRTVEELSIEYGDTPLRTIVDALPNLRRLRLDGAPRTDLDGGGPFPGLLAIGQAAPWLPMRGAFPNLRVVAGQWHDIAVARAAHRHAAAIGLDAIVHLSIAQLANRRDVGELAALRTLGPAETRIAQGPMRGFASLGWAVRLWRHSAAAAIAWVPGFASHELVEDVLQPLIDSGTRRVQLYAEPTSRPSRVRVDPVGDVAAYCTRRGIQVELGEPIDLAGFATPPP